MFGRRVAAASVVGVCLAAAAAAQETVEVSQPDNMAVTRPIREFQPGWQPYADNRSIHEPFRVPALQPPPRRAGFVDPAQQAAGGSLEPLAASAVIAGPSFAGIGNGIAGHFVGNAPPDTVGAVGPNHFVQWVNVHYAMYDKNSGALVAGPISGNQLFSALGGVCATENSGDPIVLYDRLAGRWLLSQFAFVNSATTFYQCVAVSRTADPTGAYNLYSYAYDALNDYPKLGVWPDGYYVTYNMFAAGTFAYAGQKVCVFDRAAMIAGTAATQVCVNLGTTEFGYLPSDLDGTRLPPTGTPNYLLTLGSSGSALRLREFLVDWNQPANSTVSAAKSIAVPAYAEPASEAIPQPGTAQLLDSLGDRLMYRLAYRNFGTHESLVVNHSVTTGGRTGVRWYELRSPASASPTVQQASTFAPDDSHRWMGSVAMDRLGNMLMGYSVSAGSAARKPSLFVTGRLVGDAASQMRDEVQVLAGTGVQTDDRSPLSRWGDYSSVSLDPTDDCTFYFTSQYIPSNGTFNWRTWIASYRYAACMVPEITSHPASTTITAGNTAQLTVTATGSGLAYQWYQGTSPSTATPISGATGSTYTTPALTTTTSYWVRVSNGYGAANSNTATVTVTGGVPTLTSQPASQIVLPGATATLSVTATGSTPFTYQWYQGASGNTGSPISGANGSSYTTPALTTTASYWVRVTNGFGSGDSDTATVSVGAAAVWTNVVAATASGASLTKSATTSNWDSGAVSVQTLASGDG
ncbi:MAG: hypothetical protein NDJ94_24455, partial [Vicinamibacteria bacterium]|nr:hypothetical protein [Vicinamibacteria bacterium]